MVFAETDWGPLNAFLIAATGLLVVLAHFISGLIAERKARKLAFTTKETAKELKAANHTLASQVKEQLDDALESEGGIKAQLAAIQRWQKEHAELLKTKVGPGDLAQLKANVNAILDSLTSEKDR